VRTGGPNPYPGARKGYRPPDKFRLRPSGEHRLPEASRRARRERNRARLVARRLRGRLPHGRQTRP
jgi:hypothetical protein